MKTTFSVLQPQTHTLAPAEEEIINKFLDKTDDDVNLGFQTGEINIHLRGDGDRSLVHYALFRKTTQALEVLLGAGLPVDDRSDDESLGYTPLHTAVTVGEDDDSPPSLEMVGTLLNNYADPNAKLTQGQETPLHLLAKRITFSENEETKAKLIELVDFLVSEGGDLDAADSIGNTPLRILENAGVMY